LASNEFLGLALDSDRVYAALIRKVKGGMELVGVETLELPESLDEAGREQENQDITSLEEDNVFGVGGESGSDDAIDLGDEAELDTPEDFEMSEDIEDEVKSGDDEENGNAQELAALFTRIGKNKLQVGANVPIGKSFLQQLTDIRPKKMKKHEREDFFASKLMPIYSDAIQEDQYSWEVDDTGNGWLLSYDNDTSFLKLIDQTDGLYSGKTVIREVLSDEVIHIGLARIHYELPESEITGLVHIGQHVSRLVFLKGDQMIQVIPIINEGSKSDHILETVFSKLLFEIDKGTLPALHRLIIMQSDNLGVEARDYLRSQFEDIEVELFNPEPDKLIIPEELTTSVADLQPYVTAIGAAWAASGVNSDRFPDLSLTPEYIKERQRVFKLEWHGVALLVLIALTPLLINKWYQDGSEEVARLTNLITLTETQIADTRPVSEEVERLTAELGMIGEINSRLNELSENNLLWTETLDRLNRGMIGRSGTWLTSMQVADDDLVLEGYSLYRRQIPQVSEIFNDAHIMQVTEGEMRGQDINRFSIRVRNFREDGEGFNPEIPEPDNQMIQELRPNTFPQ